jgi:hypothetical protein
MNSNRKIAAIVGALFLISNITFLLGAMAFVEPILGAPDYLTLASVNRSQIILGVLLEIANGIAYIGIAVLMFPILKQRFESLALAYVGFRLIEFVMQVASDLSPLKLLTLSEEFVKAGAPDSAAFQALGILLLAERTWAFEMVGLVFAVSALMFYTMLYRSTLIPRFIAIWGLVGATFVLVSFLANAFDLTLSPGLELILGLPMLLNELFLGLWLIVKGFNSPSIVSEPLKTVLNAA